MSFPLESDRRALVRSLVAEFASDELPHFDLMTEAYFASPHAARRARKPRDDPGGLLADPGDPTFTSLAWAVFGGLTTELVILGIKQSRFGIRKIFRRKTPQNPDSPLLELPPGAEAHIRALIIEELAKHHPDQAGAIADRAIERWKRRDWTVPE